MTLHPHLRRWTLEPDGEPFSTHSSDLWPVRWQGRPAMLKVARGAEEERGHGLMVWLAGMGAAQVYRHEGAALLLERIEGEHALSAVVQAGHDDEASRLLCAVAGQVHAPRAAPWPDLLPLPQWFRALALAQDHGELFAHCWAVAQALLATPQDVRPLHGDLHHGNVLHSAARGWLVIDPKGLLGERGFDFANLLCNPSLDIARQPGRLERQAGVIAAAAGLDRARLLAWVAAYAGLSAAWHSEDGQTEEARHTLEIAQQALALSSET
ncbi:aminoglycoside phosphotransferase family protein [Deinococcus multiflagellatus]|uniref:Aminoglycoside phosphotransferase family protein n=1 Tax=Deinococcus multiflagellatus TaxID=1656887 RepID=A0ABW1ZH28_9DEIO|nr:aminoglycoside phosphotransferase family protein [Deinococcus multiflagellatus]MBZ9713708.1 phosphotransferase [Deinococcus multiflagellatus]